MMEAIDSRHPSALLSSIAQKAQLQRSLALTREAEKQLSAGARTGSPHTSTIPAVNSVYDVAPSSSTPLSTPYLNAQSGVTAFVDPTYNHPAVGRGLSAAEEQQHRWRRAPKTMGLSPSPLSNGISSSNSNISRNGSSSSDYNGSDSGRGGVAGRSTHYQRPVGRHHHSASQLLSVDPSAIAAAVVDDSSVSTSSLLREGGLPSSRRALLDLFRQFDVNCTGAVSSREFVVGLAVGSGTANAWTPEQRSMLIKRLDKDNRGEIRYINLVKLVDQMGGGDNGTASSTSHPADLDHLLSLPAPPPPVAASFVPIPPFGVDVLDHPAVEHARRNRSRPARSLAIERAADMHLRGPDGRMHPAYPLDAPPTAPQAFAALQHSLGGGGGGVYDALARPPGFVERYQHTLGPTNMLHSVTAHPATWRAGNTEGWGSERGPRSKPDVAALNYDTAVLDPASSSSPSSAASTVTGSLRAISARLGHEPRRFRALMRSLDLDGDGAVTHREFLRGMEQLGLQGGAVAGGREQRARTNQLIQALDKQGTGQVRYEEVAGILGHYAREAKLEQAEQARAAVAAAAPAPLQAQPSFSSPSPSPSFAHGFIPSPAPYDPLLQQQHDRAAVAAAAVAQDREHEHQRHLEQYEQQQWALQQQQQQLQQQYEQAREREEQQYRQRHEEQARVYDDIGTANERVDQRDGEWVERSAAQQNGGAVASPAAVTASPDPSLAATQPQPVKPLLARYPYANSTAEQRERYAELQRAEAEADAVAMASLATTLDRSQLQQQQQQQQQQLPLSDPPPQSQEGRALPVLPVEYPRSRRPRSRASSVSSDRSVRSSRSVRSQSSQRSFGGRNALPFDPATATFGGSTSSRTTSRRGSFSHAPRDGPAGASVSGTSTPRRSASVTRDTRLGGASPADSPAAAAANSIAAARGNAFNQDGGEFFKILRLSHRPPLSTPGKAVVANREALLRSTGGDVMPLQSPHDFPVFHADAATPSGSATPAAAAQAPRSLASTVAAPLLSSSTPRRDSPSPSPLSYSQSFSGGWTDRRARDFAGSQWTLG